MVADTIVVETEQRRKHFSSAILTKDQKPSNLLCDLWLVLFFLKATTIVRITNYFFKPLNMTSLWSGSSGSSGSSVSSVSSGRSRSSSLTSERIPINMPIALSNGVSSDGFNNSNNNDSNDDDENSNMSSVATSSSRSTHSSATSHVDRHGLPAQDCIVMNDYQLMLYACTLGWSSEGDFAGTRSVHRLENNSGPNICIRRFCDTASCEVISSDSEIYYLQSLEYHDDIEKRERTVTIRATINSPLSTEVHRVGPLVVRHNNPIHMYVERDLPLYFRKRAELAHMKAPALFRELTGFAENQRDDLLRAFEKCLCGVFDERNPPTSAPVRELMHMRSAKDGRTLLSYMIEEGHIDPQVLSQVVEYRNTARADNSLNDLFRHTTADDDIIRHLGEFPEEWMTMEPHERQQELQPAPLTTARRHADDLTLQFAAHLEAFNAIRRTGRSYDVGGQMYTAANLKQLDEKIATLWPIMDTARHNFAYLLRMSLSFGHKWRTTLDYARQQHPDYVYLHHEIERLGGISAYDLVYQKVMQCLIQHDQLSIKQVGMVDHRKFPLAPITNREKAQKLQGFESHAASIVPLLLRNPDSLQLDLIDQYVFHPMFSKWVDHVRTSYSAHINRVLRGDVAVNATGEPISEALQAFKEQSEVAGTKFMPSLPSVTNVENDMAAGTSWHPARLSPPSTKPTQIDETEGWTKFLNQGM